MKVVLDVGAAIKAFRTVWNYPKECKISFKSFFV